MLKKIIIAETSAGRLDQLLKQQLPEHSRAFLTKLIKQGNVLIDGQKTKPSIKISKGQKIEIIIPKKETLKPEKGKLDIVYEDKNVLVINKPAGLAMHPGAGVIKNTLAGRLLNYLPALKNVGEPMRPGIVHRLDKDTSGLVIVAKNENARLHLINQFKNRLVEKEYLALIKGKITPEKGAINRSLARSKKQRTKITTALLGKPAITEYKTVKSFRDFTLLACFPRTGRTHQIRVHLASVGHPIVGDKTYGPKKQALTAPRQLLHAHHLKITLPDGKTKQWTAEMPTNFASALKKLI